MCRFHGAIAWCADCSVASRAALPAAELSTRPASVSGIVAAEFPASDALDDMLKACFEGSA